MTADFLAAYVLDFVRAVAWPVAAVLLMHIWCSTFVVVMRERK